jgi:hypothetical protein
MRDDQADTACLQDSAARDHWITSSTRESSAIVRLQRELSAANERLHLAVSIRSQFPLLAVTELAKGQTLLKFFKLRLDQD